MKLECVLALLILVTSAHATRAEESEWGSEDYTRYCSACHGEAADGKGPVANLLTPAPPPLTRLRAKFGYPLSTEFVAYVMGTRMPRAHGTSDMPVWGQVLEKPDGSDGEGVRTIWRIAAYLDSIQEKSE